MTKKAAANACHEMGERRGRIGVRLLTGTALAATAALILMGHAHARADETAPAAQTAEAPVEVSISPQPMASALNALSEQTGLSFVYATRDLEGVSSRGASGRMTAREALDRLLAGSGFTARQVSARTVAIEPVASAPVQDGAIQLGAVRVEGTADTVMADPSGEPYRTSGSSAYISQERVQRFRGTSAGDFLSGVTGVVNGDNRNSGALDVNIRGMQGMDRVPVVIDGSLQQSTVYRGYSGVAGRTYLDPDLIGSVRIEKGPSAQVDGVGATGGVVRVDTIGIDDLVARDGDFGYRFRAGLVGNTVSPPAIGALGTGNGTPERFDRPELLEFNSGSVSLAVGRRFDRFDIVAAFARRDVGNYFAGERGEVPPGGGTSVTGGALRRYNLGEEVLSTSQDNTSYLLRGIVRPSDDMALDVSYMRYESDFGEMMPSQIVRFGGAMQAPLSRTEVDTYSARYRWQPHDRRFVDLEAGFWATQNFTSIETLYRYELANGNVLNSDVAYQSQSDRWGVNLANTSRLTTVIGALQLNYGGSYTRERLSPPDGWEDYKDNSDYTNFVEPRDGWRNEYSAFIAAELRPQDWLTLSGALRYTETESQDYNEVDISLGSGQGRVTGYNHEKNSALAPMLSILVEPVSGLQVYGRYAEATRAPSLFESTTGFSFYPDPRNPVRPERTRNTEFGLNYQRGSLFADEDLLQLKLAFFHNVVDDYITRGTDADGFPVPMENIDRAEFQGVEASGRYDTGRVYAEFGATIYTDKQFCDQDGVCREGNTINSYIPAHIPPEFSASATFGLRLFDERLDTGLRYTHMGERNTDFVTWGGSVSVIEWGAYDVVDLFATYRVNDSISLDVAVDNLTDRYYTDALSLGLMPSPGRTLRLGVTAAYGAAADAESRLVRRASIDSLLDAGGLGDQFAGDWSGFYLGVQGGHDWISSRGMTTDADGTASVTAASESTDVAARGSALGVYAGRNWQIGSRWVIGIEGDVARLSATASQYAVSLELLHSNYGPDETRYQAGYQYYFEGLATLRGRLGYASGNTLVYATAGPAWLRERQERTQYRDRSTNRSPDSPFGPYSETAFMETAQLTRSGWTVGGGGEIALGARWSLKAEYLYAHFERADFNFADARAGVGRTFTYQEVVGYGPPTVIEIPGLGPIEFPNPISEERVYHGTSDMVVGRQARNDAEIHNVRVGLAYRF